MSGYHSFIYFAGFHLARVDGVIGGTGKKYSTIMTTSPGIGGDG